MKKKKIIYFTDTTAYGGAEKYIKILSIGIDKTKFDVRVALPKRKETEDFYNELLENKIKVDFVESSPYNIKESFLNSIIYFLKIRPNIIHFNLSDYINCKYVIIMGLVYKLFFPSTKLFLTEHYTPPNEFATGINRRFRKYYYNKIDCAMVVSNKSKNILIKNHRMPGNKICVIYNGIDIEKFSYCDDSIIEKYRKEFSISKRDLIFGIIARIDLIKGHQYFIEASIKVIKRYPMCKFLIIGEGNKEIIQKLRNQINSLDLSDCFIFLGHQKNIAELLQIIDIFVLPSLFEGLPFSIIEAMAMKKPVISTNVGGISELVVDRKTGILVPPKDSDELANAMLELADNYEERINYGLNGYKLVMEKFTQRNMLKEVENIYL